MTTSRTRARLRDGAALLARRAPALRRRLDTLPVKPPARHDAGLVVRGPAIAGAMLPQPHVVDADGRRVLLDELLGSSFALLEVEPIRGGGRSAVWERLGARRVRLSLDGPLPSAVADADGLLRTALADCGGQIVVVRPDRFVLGAFAPDQEQDFLSRWDRLGGPVAAARVPAPVRSPT